MAEGEGDITIRVGGWVGREGGVLSLSLLPFSCVFRAT